VRNVFVYYVYYLPPLLPQTYARQRQVYLHIGQYVIINIFFSFQDTSWWKCRYNICIHWICNNNPNHSAFPGIFMF